MIVEEKRDDTFNTELMRLQDRLRAQLLGMVANAMANDKVSIEVMAEMMNQRVQWLRGKLVGPLGLSLEDAVLISTRLGRTLVIGDGLAPAKTPTSEPEPSRPGQQVEPPLMFNPSKSNSAGHDARA